MSRRHRPLGEYLRAAQKLAQTKPQFQKYVGRQDLTAQEKSTIARVARLPPLEKRTDAEYTAIATRLSKFAPGLKKYKRRKKLNNGEKSAIAHKEKILRYSDHLIPIPAKDRKKAIREKWDMFAPGVFAMQLRGTATDAKIIKLDKNMTVTSNGRTWLYWRIDNVKPRGMKKAGDAAFNEFQATFDIEKLSELAKRAFTTKKPVAVELWAESGRVGEPFKTFDEFIQWLYEDYSHYKNVERWVRGIAILIHGDIKDEMREYRQRKREDRRFNNSRRQRRG